MKRGGHWVNGRLMNSGRQQVGDLCDVYVPGSSSRVNVEPWIYLGVCRKKDEHIDSVGFLTHATMAFMSVPMGSSIIRLDLSRFFDYVDVISPAE